MKDYNFMIEYCNYTKRTPSDEIAVFEYDRNTNYTYNDLEDRANRLANYLVDELKLNKGDRIAFCCRNSVEMIDAFIATSKIGAILTTYNCMLREEELLTLIKNETPKVLFYDDIYLNRIEKIRDVASIASYVVIGKNCELNNDANYKDIMKYYNNSYIKREDIQPEDIHMLIHTGGTTGTPKAAMISYKSIYYNVLSEIETLSLTEKDISYTFLPLFHTAAWNVFTIPLLFTGGKVIFTKEFTPKKALKIFEEEKPSVALGVSTIFRMFVNEENFASVDFSSLRFLLSGAAPTPKNIIDIFLAKGVKIGAAYGMTECGPNNMVSPVENMLIEDIKDKWNSSGKPMKYNEVKMIDNNGDEVGVNEIGELIWRGNLIFSGYWNNEDETRKTLIDGWVHTGDMATIDEDGFYYIVGRRKNMFITGGENIFPPEIEEVLYKHPNVHEVCVIGVDDEKWGEVGKAIIVLKEGKHINEKEFRGFLKDKISSIKIPKYYQIVDSLPKNNVGKIEIEKIKKEHRYSRAI